MLPPNLKNRAQLYASKKGISIGEMIRQALEEKLSQNQKTDPFFMDTSFFEGNIPKDLSFNHDEYLYDDIH
jgi:hypothetical protein